MCFPYTVFFFKQKTAYEMRISDWSSDVCSSDLANPLPYNALANGRWGALVLYAAVPPAVGLLARAGALAPFAPVGGGSRERSLRSLVLSLGVVTADRNRAV